MREKRKDKILLKNSVMEEEKRLREELEKVKSQFYIFYELTQAMRATLRLDEIVYIILTGLTARQGLGFNRALLFLCNQANTKVQGFMGIGPMDSEEANKIWSYIENQKMGLYDLIKVWRKIKENKIKPRFMELVRSLSFPLNEGGGIIAQALYKEGPLHIKIKEEKTAEFKKDPLIEKLKLKEFVLAPLRTKNKPLGIIVVDNYITKKPITEEDIRILSMFVNQCALAVENSKIFENTLLKAHTDTLTALWNYGYFQYKLDEELMKAKKENLPLSVIMLDLDNFKKFNDTFGHPKGDLVLQEIGNILKKNSRKGDIPARYGGEEFTLILPFTTKKEALVIGERIRKTIEEKEILGKHFTVSMGIASFPYDAQSKEELMNKADIFLYKAKQQGKNKIVVE
ncbi:MAG: hypothetical protein B6D55_03950 [Candidatus Omnitrophica bacterium 4484_70.2]|nr:MAG: hypothetical protein B6D55_03950 [Candidatus Omnitrophica bacterium 4484_70.2]